MLDKIVDVVEHAFNLVVNNFALRNELCPVKGNVSQTFVAALGSELAEALRGCLLGQTIRQFWHLHLIVLFIFRLRALGLDRRNARKARGDGDREC